MELRFILEVAFYIKKKKKKEFTGDQATAEELNEFWQKLRRSLCYILISGRRKLGREAV